MSISQNTILNLSTTQYHDNKRWFVGTELLRRKWTKHDVIVYDVADDDENVHTGTIINIGSSINSKDKSMIMVKDVDGCYFNHQLAHIRVRLEPNDTPTTFQVGDEVDCRDGRGDWYPATVLLVKPAYEAEQFVKDLRVPLPMKQFEAIYVRFTKFNIKYNKWIVINDDALCDCMESCSTHNNRFDFVVGTHCKNHCVCREVHWQSRHNQARQWSELCPLPTSDAICSVVLCGEALWLSTMQREVYVFDCQSDTFNPSGNSCRATSMCRVDDSTIMLADSNYMRTLNVNSDGLVRGFGRPIDIPSDTKLGRCPLLQRIGNSIRIESEFEERASADSKIKELIYSIKKGTFTHSNSHRQAMNGESQVVIEDESGTRLFRFGGASGAKGSFWETEALRDEQWMQRNIQQPLVSALDLLAETKYDTNIPRVIIDYVYSDSVKIIWKEAPQRRLPKSILFCGAVHTKSFIIIFGGESLNCPSDEIYVLDTRSNEGWIKSTIKCPFKCCYIAALDNQRRVHIFPRRSPNHHYPSYQKMFGRVNTDNVTRHFCIALKDIMSNFDCKK